MKLGPNISYVTIEALPQRYIKDGLMSTECEKHVIYGVLAGLKVHMVGDDATPIVIIQTPGEALIAINLMTVNIVSIDAYDGITREFCIFRAVEDDQKKAFEIITDYISMFTEEKRLQADTSMIDIDTYMSLPDRFVKGIKKSSNFSTQNNTVKSASANNTGCGTNGTAGCGAVGANYAAAQRRVHNTPTYGYSTPKPLPRFFTRTSKTLKQSALKLMLDKVKAIQTGDYEEPNLPELPEELPAESKVIKKSTTYNNSQFYSHY